MKDHIPTLHESSHYNRNRLKSIIRSALMFITGVVALMFIGVHYGYATNIVELI